MERVLRSHVTEDEFRALFDAGRPLRIADLPAKLGVHPTTVWRLMERHGAIRSVNRNAGFCVLPRMCRFDAPGFHETRGILFFRDGNQLDAIVRLVEASEAGMTLGEVRAAMNLNPPMQLLGLVHEGRLRRDGKPRSYVYLAGDAARADEQRRRRRAAERGETPDVDEKPVTQRLAEESRGNLELLVEVLLTCLRHPEFTAKAVALSLIRRGRRTCTAQVRELLERFDVAKKGGSWH